MARQKLDIEYPKNLTAQGRLSFPLTSEEDLEALTKWRLERGIEKPKYEDKIGVTLFISPANLEKVITYLKDTFLPHAIELNEKSDGKKGLTPAQVKDIEEILKTRKWKKNLPIRALTEKDKENLGDDASKFVAKLKISGPYQAAFQKKAIVTVNNKQTVVGLDEVNEFMPDGQGIPSEASDETKLWWGANWYFRAAMRLNAYYNEDNDTMGITAYGSTLYLLPHLGMPVGGYNTDADVVDDGDDWGDE